MPKRSLGGTKSWACPIPTISRVLTCLFARDVLYSLASFFSFLLRPQGCGPGLTRRLASSFQKEST